MSNENSLIDTNGSRHEKVTTHHLQRKAYLYVRQSTLRQVFEHQESTKRQYALRAQAVALGWQEENIEVIDSDLGQSGASSADRKGFQKLVSEVGLGQVGVVMGLEVSRLARNNSDWHRLLEICAITDTLILDEDGLYDPKHFNDRLLLGLKGTMSEAELHLLRARLQGGILNKARRGELKMPLPVGLVYDLDDRVVLDPDEEVRKAVAHFFATFKRTGSALATVKAFDQEGVRFPRRGKAGKGDIVWEKLVHSRALQTLHNPRYAGAFVFGRTRSWRDAEGKQRYEVLPPDQWQVTNKDAHVGYISWEDFESNLKRLRENCRGYGEDRKRRVPGCGPALLQGMVICGKCGQSMTLRYHWRQGREWPDYVCQREGIEHGQKICQTIAGRNIDEAVSRLILESVTPLGLETVLEVQRKLEHRLEEVDQLRRQRVERARYEAEKARQRYLQVDNANRLVAANLEAEWNEKLRILQDAQDTYQKQKNAFDGRFDKEQEQEILQLAESFPQLWNDADTSHRDRKRMARLIIKDVTLTKGEEVLVQVRFTGGASKVLHVPLGKRAWELRQTKKEIVAEIDRLLDTHTESQIVVELNGRGWRSGSGKSFTLRIVQQLRRAYQLVSRYDRLRKKGLLTKEEVAEMVGTRPSLVNYWRKQGLLRGKRFSDKNEYLYFRPAKAKIKQIKSRMQLNLTN